MTAAARKTDDARGAVMATTQGLDYDGGDFDPPSTASRALVALGLSSYSTVSAPGADCTTSSARARTCSATTPPRCTPTTLIHRGVRRRDRRPSADAAGLSAHRWYQSAARRGVRHRLYRVDGRRHRRRRRR